MTDCLAIRGLILWTHIGVTEEERTSPQRVLVDVEMTLPTGDAARADDVSLSVDYAAVTEAIQSLSKKSRKTMERLAEDIAALVLRFEQVVSVIVTVQKRCLPCIHAAEVRIERKR